MEIKTRILLPSLVKKGEFTPNLIPTKFKEKLSCLILNGKIAKRRSIFLTIWHCISNADSTKIHSPFFFFIGWDDSVDKTVQ